MKKFRIVRKADWENITTENQKLTQQLSAAWAFVEAMKAGDLNARYDESTSQNQLGHSLLALRDRMIELNKEEQQRNWANQGLAKFADILRLNQHENINTLFDQVISNLVNYVAVNQGGIFVLTKESNNESYLELISCYAYQKKKFLKKRIALGEGLVGQCFLEKEVIYITDVPQDYIEITSGLGAALPRNILIVPMMLDTEVLGIIELASFTLFEKYQIDFIQRVAQNIASAYSSVRVTERTRVLLEESQIQAEQLRAQEEEVRQNMEEMQATQEEMTRIQLETQAQTNIINSIAIVSKTDVRGNITYVNDEFLKWAKYTRDEVIGKNHNILKSGHQPDEIFVDLWKTISSGKIWRGEVKNKAKDGSYYWVDAIIAPVLDYNGKPKEYIAQRFVINDKKEKEALMHSLLEDGRAKEEELRQNMEEMQTTQEEMTRIQLETQAQTNIINSIAIVSKTDVRGNITYVNEQFLKWSKYTREEVMGKNHNILKSGHQPDEIFVDLWKTISSGKIWRGEVKNKAKDGSYYWVDAIIAPVLDSNGKPKEYIAQRFVINDKKELSQRVNNSVVHEMS